MPRTKAENLVPVHNMVRYINKQGAFAIEGSIPVEAVDNDVAAWIEKGYQLFSTHYLGETPDAYGMLYVLTLKDA